MSASESSKPLITRSTALIVLVLLLAVVCGFQWWRLAQSAPVRAHIEAGISYLEQGQSTAAEQEWRKAVGLDPNNAEAWEFLGNYYMAARNWAAAREAWKRVLELKTATPQLHYNLAVCNIQLDDKMAARHHAEEVVKRDANHIGALDILTTVLVREADAKVRLKYLQQLTKLQPQNDDYLARLAEALMRENQYKQARPLLDKLVKLKPDFGPAHSLRGAAILYTDPSPQGLALAVSEIKKALAQNPDDEVAILFLGKVYIQMKKPKEAILYLEKLSRHPTAHISYLFELAKAYQLLGDEKKAREIRQRYAFLQQQEIQVSRLESKVAKNPQDFDAALQLGLLLLQSPKPVGAEKYINQAAALRPADSRSKKALSQLENLYAHHLSVGLKALRQRDNDKVGHHLGQAMMLRPQDNRTFKAIQQFQEASTTTLPSSRVPSQNSAVPQGLIR